MKTSRVILACVDKNRDKLAWKNTSKLRKQAQGTAELKETLDLGAQDWDTLLLCKFYLPAEDGTIDRAQSA